MIRIIIKEMQPIVKGIQPPGQLKKKLAEGQLEKYKRSLDYIIRFNIQQMKRIVKSIQPSGQLKKKLTESLVEKIKDKHRLHYKI